jgi:hypothetical protein
MSSRLTAILVCVMTGLCPAVCTAELAAHSREIDDGRDGSIAKHEHQHDNPTHHQHDSNGEPVPHSEHTCICTGGPTPGPIVQVPSLERAGAIAEQDAVHARVGFVSNLDLSDLRLLDDRPERTRNAPLLI